MQPPTLRTEFPTISRKAGEEVCLEGRFESGIARDDLAQLVPVLLEERPVADPHVVAAECEADLVAEGEVQEDFLNYFGGEGLEGGWFGLGGWRIGKGLGGFSRANANAEEVGHIDMLGVARCSRI